MAAQNSCGLARLQWDTRLGMARGFPVIYADRGPDVQTQDPEGARIHRDSRARLDDGKLTTRGVLVPLQETGNCNFRMMRKLVWKNEALGENTYLRRVVPINNLRYRLREPTKVLCVALRKRMSSWLGRILCYSIN